MPSPPPTKPGVPVPDGGARPLDGGLLVHTTGSANPDGGFTGVIYAVLLGDGTTYAKQVDVNGDVQFEDVALPQDVTFVEDVEGALGPTMTKATTVVGVDRREIFFAGTGPQTKPCPCASQGTVQGQILGAGASTSRWLKAVSTDGHLVDAIVNGSTFTFSSYRPAGAPNTYDLVAGEKSASGELLTIGVRRNVVMTGGVLSGQDVTLDRPVDQTLTVNLPGDGGMAPSASDVVFGTRLHGRYVFFASGASGAFPVTFKSAQAGGPLDVLMPTLAFQYGTSGYEPGQIDPTTAWGYSTLLVPQGTAQVTAPLMTPAMVTAPVLGTPASPTPASAVEGFSVSWDAGDPTTTFVELSVETTQVPPALKWHVYLPPSRKTFTFFPLPPGVAPKQIFPSGKHLVQLSQVRLPSIANHMARFAAPGGPDAVDITNRCSTSQRGIVSFQ